MKWLGLRSKKHRRSGLDPHASTIYAAAALVLAYPHQELIDRLDPIEEAVASAGATDAFAPVLAHLREDLTQVQCHYAQEFDYSRRHALNLTYWIDGDTRRRGESLLRYKQAYRDSGLWVDLDGELPDYLPMVLEYAVHDPTGGRELLTTSRPALELLRLALRDDDLPHEGVVAAVCATLPGESPNDRLSVARMSGWQPPTETVGIGAEPVLAPYSMSAPSMPHGARLPLIDAQEL